MTPFRPADALPGTVLVGIDPSSLLSNRDELEQSRLDLQHQLIRASVKRHTMIQVNCEGVIISGNHGARAAAEAGVAIEIEIIDVPHPHHGPILGIPVATR